MGVEVEVGASDKAVEGGRIHGGGGGKMNNLNKKIRFYALHEF